MSTVTKISETRTVSTETSTGLVRHFTTVVERQDSNGCSRRVTTVFVGHAAGYRHIMLRCSSEPWA